MEANILSGKTWFLLWTLKTLRDPILGNKKVSKSISPPGLYFLKLSKNIIIIELDSLDLRSKPGLKAVMFSNRANSNPS